MEWEELIADRIFITDLGADCTNREDSKICRYAVWAPGNDMAGHRIIEVNNNLQMLQEKYHVEDEMVMKME